MAATREFVIQPREGASIKARYHTNNITPHWLRPHQVVGEGFRTVSIESISLPDVKRVNFYCSEGHQKSSREVWFTMDGPELRKLRDLLNTVLGDA